MNRKSLCKISWIFSILIYVCITQFALAQKFVIPVLPDTQCEINRNPAMFTSQMQWIVDNKDSLNIPIALHVGDVVDFNNLDHYKRASEGFKILDNAHVPYAITLGNHDTGAVGEHSGSAAPGNVNSNLRITDKFNTFFPASRFAAQKGRYEDTKSDNAYYTFKAGGLDWLVLTLEFCARREPVAWAGKIISEHPAHNIIVLTHYHLDSKGMIAQDHAGYGDLSPQVIYDQVIKQYSNVRLVLSGHVGNSAYRDDIGVKGNHIYQLLQDYQGEEDGGGYIRLLEIDPGAGTLSCKMYSPFHKRTKEDSSQFSFSKVDFIRGKSEK